VDDVIAPGLHPRIYAKDMTPGDWCASGVSASIE